VRGSQPQAGQEQEIPMSKAKTRSITVIGRRWFQRGPGNTYFTATVLVNGKRVAKVGPAYGYDSMYEQAAWKWLDANALAPGREHHANGSSEAPWRYCERMGIAYHYEAADVAREKDL
jgi:hypothetical protein